MCIPSHLPTWDGEIRRPSRIGRRLTGSRGATDQPSPTTVEGYIKGFPPDLQAVLTKIRAAVKKAAPAAREAISYRMPAYFDNGILIYFAAFKKHIGVFPPVHDPALKSVVAKYAGPKGNLQFPLSEPIPYALIGRIVTTRLRENRASAR